MLAGISDNIIMIVWCDILRTSLCWTVCLFVNRCTLFLKKLLHACFQINFTTVISQIRINTGIRFGRFVILIVSNNYL